VVSTTFTVYRANGGPAAILDQLQPGRDRLATNDG
jgi:hypothetical protein